MEQGMTFDTEGFLQSFIDDGYNYEMPNVCADALRARIAELEAELASEKERVEALERVKKAAGFFVDPDCDAVTAAICAPHSRRRRTSHDHPQMAQRAA